QADTFLNDVHKGLKADFILANPPFNIKDWGGDKLQDDVRWKYGIPPQNNANFAWVQHMISKLAPAGTAGFVLANGSMSSNASGEGEIRKNLIENDLVECIVTLPGQLFYSTQIPVCLWFISKNKMKTGKRERDNKILFIDARQLGFMADRTHKEFSKEDINKIAETFHAWRGTNEQEYTDELGFCKEATIEEVREHYHVLTPGRYVGLAEQEDDGELFEEKMERLTSELAEQFSKSKELEEQIRTVLGGIG
ncbi:N-6 DNA methylase, partial [Exiguobacterium sp. A1_3_1]|uniref:N-6 DNA methylase n=1 Tax=Exiguobacterium sp. A1_3_1 TaxID=2651871 RepID=UPI003B87CD9C